MNTTENQNDPYSHLNPEYLRSLCGGYEPHCINWTREMLPDGYRPLAKGEVIQNGVDEIYYECATPKWHKCSSPEGTTAMPTMQHRRTKRPVEYRIAPDPAPAGKLSDEQLGEIGKAAAKCTVHWSQINTAFAAAVREAVEREQAQSVNFLSSDKRRDWPEDSQHENGNYMCKCCECGKSFIGHKRRAACKICVGIKDGIKQAEEIARLTAEIASLQKNYDIERNCSAERMTQILNLQRDLEKSNAELERLRESLSRIALLPEKWENEPAGIDPSGVMDCVRELRSALSPAHTAKEKEKLECEKWVKTQPDITHESIAIARRAWQAARGKEAK